MGNQTSIQRPEYDEVKDKQFLTLNSLSLFQDEFLVNVLRDLNQLDTLKESIPENSLEEDLDLLKFQRLRDIFGKQKFQNLKAEDLDKVLLNEEILKNSKYNVNQERRNKILFRTLHARAYKSSTSNESMKTKYLTLPDISSGTNSHDNVLNTFSLGMNITIIKALGRTMPEVSKIILKNLIISLNKFLCKKELTIVDIRIIGELMAEHFDLSNEMQTEHDTDSFRLAISFDLIVALFSGSVEKVLKVVSFLLNNTIELDPTILPILQYFSNISPGFHLSTPNIGISYSYNMKISIPDPFKKLISHPSLLNITTDGTFFYIYDGYNHCFKKIGSGFHDTIAGDSIHSSNNMSYLTKTLSNPLFLFIDSKSVRFTDNNKNILIIEHAPTKLIAFPIDTEFPINSNVNSINSSLLGRCYFEIEILNFPVDSNLYIGLNPFDDYIDDINKCPNASTIFFSSHGCLQFNSTKQTTDNSWKVGDIIGCGVDMEIKKVFFTYNGTKLEFLFDINNDQFKTLKPFMISEQFENIQFSLITDNFKYQNSDIRESTFKSSPDILPGSIAHINEKVIFHPKYQSCSYDLMIYDSKTLNIEKTINISPLLNASDRSLYEIYEDIINISLDDTVLCLNKMTQEIYTTKVLSALLDTGEDITTEISKIFNFYNNLNSSVIFHDISEIKSNYSQARNLRVKYQILSKNVSSLQFPITNANGKLLCIHQIISKKIPFSPIFNPIQDIVFDTIYSESGYKTQEFTPLIQSCWRKYLQFISTQLSDYSFEDDWNEIKKSLLTINSDFLENDNDGIKLQYIFQEKEFSATLSLTDTWESLYYNIRDILSSKIQENLSFDIIELSYDSQENDFHLLKKLPIIFQNKRFESNQLSDSVMYSNGYELIICHNQITGNGTKETDLNQKISSWVIELNHDKAEVKNIIFQAFLSNDSAFSQSFCYDPFHNFIFGIDCLKNKLLVWKNGYDAPDRSNLYNSNTLYKETASEKTQQSLHRLSNQSDVLSNLDVVIFLLNLLEKLSEPFGQRYTTNKKLLAETHKVSIISKAGKAVDKNCFTKMFFKGCPIIFDDFEDSSIGYHMAVIDETFSIVLQKKWFDSEDDISISNSISNFIETIPNGSIVLVSSINYVYQGLNRSAYENFMKLGAPDLENQGSGKSDTVFSLIGKKGIPQGTSEYCLGRYPNIIIERILPLSNHFLAFQGDPETLQILLDLLQNIYTKVNQNGDDVMKKSFLSFLHILQSHVHHCVMRSNQDQLALIFSPKFLHDSNTFLELFIKQDVIKDQIFDQSIISIFGNLFPLLYPTNDSRFNYLVNFIDNLENGKCSDLELKLLNVLLDTINTSSITNSTLSKKFSLLYLKLYERTIRLLHHSFEMNQDFVYRSTQFGKLYSTIVNLYKNECELLFTNDFQSIFDPKNPKVSDYTLFLDILSSICQLSNDTLLLSKRYIDKKNISFVGDSQFELNIISSLEKSLVGTIFPIAIIIYSNSLKGMGYQFIKSNMDLVMSTMEEMESCLSSIDDILIQLPKKFTNYIDSFSSNETETHYFESPHPYLSNMEEKIPISFPGAQELEIVFDALSRTENNCDWLTFTDATGASLHPDIERFTGRDGSENFPGFGGRPSLKLKVNSFTLNFHSDGSVEDWGYKFRVTAKFPVKDNMETRNWLHILLFDIVNALSLLGKNLFIGPVKDNLLEDTYQIWMENTLVKPEYFLYQEESQLINEADKFLNQFTTNPQGELALNFITKMKPFVLEDQGSIDCINWAVYSTCAALIRANNMTAEALAYAKNDLNEPTQKLIKVWKAGQKMRRYFDLYDLKTAMSDAQEMKTTGPSLYAGADESVIRSSSQLVILRAKFLLRTPISRDPIHQVQDNPILDNSIESIPPPTSPTRIFKESKKQHSSNGKWKLAAKAVVKRQVSEETQNVTQIWQTLVDEAVAIDKLKNIFLHRRKYTERLLAGKELSITERVLQFVQSNVDINTLQSINRLRNNRAIVRAKGLDVYIKLFNNCRSPFALKLITQNFCLLFNSIRREDSGCIHYANRLEGCSPDQHNLIWLKFSDFLKESTQKISFGLSQLKLYSKDDIISEYWNTTIANILRICTMDYEYSDSSLLNNSGIIKIIENIFKSNDLPSEITSLAYGLLEILVSRFLTFEPLQDFSELSKSLIDLLNNMLNSFSSNFSLPKLSSTSESLQSLAFKLEGNIPLTKTSGSFVVPHHDISATHTITFQINRPKSNFVDLDFPTNLNGKKVVRGFNWPDKTEKPDDGLGSIGTISTHSPDINRVKVEWPSGMSFEYNLSKDISSTELNLADESLEGFIFAKGLPQVTGKNESLLYQSLDIFNLIAMYLLADASLVVIYQIGNHPIFYLRSKTRLAPSDWTKITLSCDLSFTLKLYINNILDNSFTLPLYSDKWSYFESIHPITQESSYEIESQAVTFPSEVEKVVLSFDPKTTFSSDTGILTFKTVNLDPIFSSQSDPIEGSRLLSAVPSEFSFKAQEAEENKVSEIQDEWGYKFGLLPLKEKDFSLLHQISSRLPIYLGHLPPFCSSNLIPSKFTGFNGELFDFSIYNSTLIPTELENSILPQKENSNNLKSELAIIKFLSILKRAIDNLNDLNDSEVKRYFTHSGLISVLFRLFTTGSCMVKCSAFVIAANFFPQVEQAIIDFNAKNFGFLSDKCPTFLHYLGNQINGWFNLSVDDTNLRESMFDSQAIYSAQLLLLRSFANGTNEWKQLLGSYLKDIAQNILIQKNLLINISMKPESPDTNILDSFSSFFIFFAFIGGNFAVLGIGSEILYVNPDSEVSEEGILLGPAESLKNDKSGLNKDFNKKELDKSNLNFGDFVSIILLSNPDEIKIVPKSSLVINQSSTKLSEGFKNFISEYLDNDILLKVFDIMALLNNIDRRPKAQTITREIWKESIFESLHEPNSILEAKESLDFPGSSEIQIIFDPQTKFCHGDTSILFEWIETSKEEKNKSKGIKAFSKNFKSTSSFYDCQSDFVIPVSKADFTVNVKSSYETEWGYKFTARALCKELLLPPMNPPLSHFDLLVDLKMLSMKSLKFLLSECDWIAEQMIPMISPLLHAAIVPKPETLVYKAGKKQAKTTIYESEHPYSDNTDSYTTVRTTGAISYSITFDNNSKTERNCDYICFYPDESTHEKLENTELYTGGKDGSERNYPGIEGRPPLIINRSSFCIFFHSDGSVNDWGYKIFVTPIYQISNDISNRELVLRSKGIDAYTSEIFATSLKCIIQDGLKPISKDVYTTLKEYQFEEVSITSPFYLKDLTYFRSHIVESKEEDLTSLIESKEEEVPLRQDFMLNSYFNNFGKYFSLLQVEKKLKIYSECNTDSSVIGELSPGSFFFAIKFKDNMCYGMKKSRASLLALLSPAKYSFKDIGWITFIENEIQTARPTQIVPYIDYLQHDFIKVIEIDPSYKNPMYLVDEPNSKQACGDDIPKNKLNINELISQDYEFIEQAISEYSRIASIGYSQESFITLINKLPDHIDTSPILLSNFDELLTFMNTGVNISLDTSNFDSQHSLSNMTLFLDKLCNQVSKDLFLSQNHILYHILLFIEKSLKDLVNYQDFNQPVTRGFEHLIKFSLSEENKNSNDWLIDFPTAKRIMLTFVDQCKLPGKDYIIIQDEKKSKRLYEKKIQGDPDSDDDDESDNNRDNSHWPGLNFSPISISGESCLVSYVSKSDSLGDKDWGFTLQAIGIYEDPEINNKNIIKETEIATAKPYFNLVIWLIQYFSSNKQLPSSIHPYIFTLDIFRTLISIYNGLGLEDAQNSKFLSIFVYFINEMSSLITANKNDLYLAYLELEYLLIEKGGLILDQYDDLTQEIEQITPEFQSIIQILISIDRAINELDIDLVALNEMKETLELVPVKSFNDSAPISNYIVRSSSHKNAIISWDITLSKLHSEEPIIGVFFEKDIEKLGDSIFGQNPGNFETIGLNHKAVWYKGVEYPISQVSKPWTENDTITIKWDKRHGRLNAYVNRVLLITLFGHTTDFPLFTNIMKDQNIEVGISLLHPEDKVKIQIFPQFKLSKSVSSDCTTLFEVLKPIYQLNEFLEDISNRKIPNFYISSSLTPLCAQFSAEIIEEDFRILKSKDILFEKEFSFPYSRNVYMVIDNINLSKFDIFEIIDEKGQTIMKSNGAKIQASKIKSFSDQLNHHIKKSLENHSIRHKLLTDEQYPASVEVKQKVVRGPNWTSGAQDGGIGYIGVVTKIDNAKTSGFKVHVKWNSGTEGTYIYDIANSMIEIIPLDSNQSVFAKTVLKNSHDNTWTINRERFTIRISRVPIKEKDADDNKEEEDVHRQIKLACFPIYSNSHCLNDPKFSSLRQRVSNTFSCNSLTHLKALTKHINKVAKSKDMDQNAILNASWSTFLPSKNDLISSTALKELFEVEDFKFSVEVEEKIGRFTSFFTKSIISSKTTIDRPELYLSDPFPECFLSSYPRSYDNSFSTLELAFEEAKKIYPECKGITKEGENNFTLRVGPDLEVSPSGEISWLILENSTPILQENDLATTEIKGEMKLSKSFLNCYLSEYASPEIFLDLETAFEKAKEIECGGITLENNGNYSLRVHNYLEFSPSGETSWVLIHSSMANDAYEIINPILSEPRTSAILSCYARSDNFTFRSFDEALNEAINLYPQCKGITQELNGDFTLRGSRDLILSESGEVSWILENPLPISTDDIEVSLNETNTIDQLRSRSTSHSSRTSSDIQIDNVNEEVIAEDDDDDDDDVEEEVDDEEEWEEYDEDEEDEIDESNHDDNSHSNSSVNESSEASRYSIRLSVDSSEEDDDGESYDHYDEDEEDGDEYEDDDDDEDDDDSNSIRSHVGHLGSLLGRQMPRCNKCQKCIRRYPPHTWQNGWSCDWPSHTGSNSFRGEDIVYGCPTIHQCNWGVCVTCWNNESSKLTVKNQNFPISSQNIKPIEVLFSLTQSLNSLVLSSLAYLDLSKGTQVPGSLSDFVSRSRGLLFENIKNAIYKESLSSSENNESSSITLELSRIRARRNANYGKCDTDGRWSVFSQAFRVLHFKPPSSLRTPNKLYTTRFTGEKAQDAGGPYRESFDIYMQELQSSSLPLLIRTPNGKHAVGFNRDKWIPNPSSCSKIQLEMFSFLGKLMGIAIRSKEYLALNMPSIVWKQIIQEPLSIEDLEAIDYSFVKSIEQLRIIDTKGIDEDTFSMTFFETFTTTTSDDRVVELIPRGSYNDVTFNNRHEYCDLVINYRLHEFEKQTSAIRDGLSQIVPIHLLTLFTWDQLEELVCGIPEINLTLLKEKTEYSSCDPNDQHIQMFWRVLEEFDNEERAALIRFAWGRSRLPINAAGFSQNFKIQSFNKSPPDSYYPVSHTCFFSIELPRYSTQDIMREKLRYAIFNCQEIDGDEGMNVTTMGWEETD